MMYKKFLYYYFKIIIIINKHLYFIILNKLYSALTKLCLCFATFPPNSHYCTAKQIEVISLHIDCKYFNNHTVIITVIISSKEEKS